MGDENCELKIAVTPRWGAATSVGTSCGWTGGHCLPCSDCGARRAEAARQQRIYDEWIAEESAAKASMPFPSSPAVERGG